MQEYREIERNAGTCAIREEAIASELMDVSDAEKEKLFQQHYRAEWNPSPWMLTHLLIISQLINY